MILGLAGQGVMMGLASGSDNWHGVKQQTAYAQGSLWNLARSKSLLNWFVAQHSFLALLFLGLLLNE